MITICYKQASGVDIHLDAWAPSKFDSTQHDDAAIQTAPAVIFFHGGGLTVGNRKSWFPEWLYRRFSEKGYLFISADYRLIPPSTGHDIVEDVQDLWEYVCDPDLVFSFPSTPQSSTVPGTAAARFRIDRDRIVLSGCSAGGLCAYLCTIHCRSRSPHLPSPKAMLSIYSMGGNFMTGHYLEPKTEPFFRGRELLDKMDPDFQPFVFQPTDNGRNIEIMFGDLAMTADSPLSYYPQTYFKPGYPSNPRMLLGRLYLQYGVYLDYYTGEHEPSLSARLRSHLSRETTDEKNGNPAFDSIIPAHHLGLFPQFMIPQLNDWPSTIFLHGKSDTAVSIEETRHLHRLLQGQQLSSCLPKDRQFRLIEVPGAEHTFDLQPGAEQQWGKLFDEAIEFVHTAIMKEGILDTVNQNDI